MKIQKDVIILLKFIHTHCKYNHRETAKLPFYSIHINSKERFDLCSECASLADYSIERRVKCPQKNKPSCKNCSIKCYSKNYRIKIKEVMKFSGMYYILHGRIDYLIKYLLR